MQGETSSTDEYHHSERNYIPASLKAQVYAGFLRRGEEEDY